MKDLGKLTDVESVMSAVLKEMRLRNIKTVLDVGCGHGAIADYFKEFDYTGIDKEPYFGDEKNHPHGKFVWGKKVQDYTPEKPFDAAWTRCFFCLGDIGSDEMRVIITWLRRWVKWIFLCDTPRVDGVEWQKMLSDAGFELEAHGTIKDTASVAEVWRNINEIG